jgi:hypothetical protein
MILADTVPDYSVAALKAVDAKRFQMGQPDFIVTFTEDKQEFYINGRKYEPTAGLMTDVRVGTYQRWRIVNDTLEIHPMRFLAYAVNGDSVHNPLRLETVNVPVGGSADVVMDFTNPLIKECPSFTVTF